jgi:hypothetical protein
MAGTRLQHGGKHSLATDCCPQSLEAVRLLGNAIPSAQDIGSSAGECEGRLNPPQAVITATDDYLESEDAMATWIAERCELKASYEDTAAELFKSWKAWAELMRENVGSAKAFGRHQSEGKRTPMLQWDPRC